MSKNLKLVDINHAGDINNEFVWLKALADVDLGDYVLMDDTFKNNHEASNTNRHLYVFPSKVIRAGECVALYTKQGADSSVANTSCGLIHYLHWNHKKSVWNKDGDTAHLLYAPKALRQAASLAK